ncbi:unnamed protein product [Clonostachys rosea f. rosea IK726]|uniref:Carbohydrate kinase PfkB domain-containing protein n=2 Tax=Bionectria ochroleuca TaxID=29856 RepID=A0A0B7JN53_BIOOC|nr:unnamed protein product [Clonostachys rosea f. rosea IK726]
MAPRITILGSLNIDLVSYVPHHPLPGETLTSNGFNSSPGGKGANQAVACAKLSRTSSLSGAYDGLAHLVVNETEAALLSGKPESELESPEGIQRVGALFLDRGVQNVIITLGGRGVYYVNKAGQGALVEAEKTVVVDTTAAGDTFVGSYALAVVGASGTPFDVDVAIRAANKASAKTVARKGAQVSIPWKDELE